MHETGTRTHIDPILMKIASDRTVYNCSINCEGTSGAIKLANYLGLSPMSFVKDNIHPLERQLGSLEAKIILMYCEIYNSSLKVNIQNEKIIPEHAIKLLGLTCNDSIITTLDALTALRKKKMNMGRSRLDPLLNYEVLGALIKI